MLSNIAIIEQYEGPVAFDQNSWNRFVELTKKERNETLYGFVLDVFSSGVIWLYIVCKKWKGTEYTINCLSIVIHV